MRIEYHPAIEGELAEIRDYYNEQSHHLGDDFINEFERQVLGIAAMPSRWMVVRGNTRRALMKRIPYLTFFRVLNDAVIRITVIKHERRHPAYGIHRR
jgi:plasmid stabilization system protein ParE